MKKIVTQALLLLFLALNSTFSFAEIACIDAQTQSKIAKPETFPTTNKSVGIACEWEEGSQSAKYQSAALNDYDNAEDVSINTLSLEDSKGIDDDLLGDNLDKNYIANVPYLVKDAKGVKNSIELFEIKRTNSGEVRIYLINKNTPRITFSCLDKSINYKKNEASHISDILLSDTCQKAMQEFNIPLSKEDIKNLVVTKGSIN
ncbi:Uncharacterised protein [Leminorella richardii]|uniref:Uncharacterized protein n=1 Tax=Leminorella richardii TaxID=158841 RepID=A0A2X4UQS6_9GAMM|nr:hypothetical protein [Leminorella richardii]SQI36972.1 Uncharacterised protein [Leminorella richardii]